MAQDVDYSKMSDEEFEAEMKRQDGEFARDLKRLDDLAAGNAFAGKVESLTSAFEVSNMSLAQDMTPEQFAAMSRNKEVITVTNSQDLNHPLTKQFVRDNPQFKEAFSVLGDVDQNGTSDTKNSYVVDKGSITGIFMTKEMKDGLASLYFPVADKVMDNLLPEMRKMATERSGQKLIDDPIATISISTNTPSMAP